MATDLSTGLDPTENKGFNIAGNLADFVETEGKQSALDWTENHRNSIEAVMEICSPSERALLAPIHAKLTAVIMTLIPKECVPT